MNLKEFASLIGANVISCANGTDALFITLKSLGVGGGDEDCPSKLGFLQQKQLLLRARRLFFVILTLILIILIRISWRLSSPQNGPNSPVHLLRKSV